MSNQSQYDSSITYITGQMVIVNEIVYEAVQDVPTQTGPPNGTYWSVVSGEELPNSPAGLPAHFVFPFAFNTVTSAIWASAGAPVIGYQPNVGDLILEAWFETDTLWNGTTPKADVGTFSGGNAGLFEEINSATVSLATADSGVTDNAGIDKIATPVLVGQAGMPLRVTSAVNPLVVVVSETGAKGGTAQGSTAGSSTLHLIVVPAN